MLDTDVIVAALRSPTGASAAVLGSAPTLSTTLPLSRSTIRCPNSTTPLPSARFADDADVEALAEEFHRVHDRVFAVKDPSSHVECIYWKGRATAVIESITAHDELVSIQLYGHPWVSGEYWPMIAPCFEVRAVDDAGGEHRGMRGSGGGSPEASFRFWFWPPVPVAASGAGRVKTLKRRLFMILQRPSPRALSGAGLLAVLGLGGLLLPLLPTWAEQQAAERRGDADPVPAALGIVNVPV